VQVLVPTLRRNDIVVATACRLAFTVCGQAAQYMFFTSNVMVFSAAKATDAA
jgi:hypothetical protein